MKYTKEQRLDIGRRIYDGEIDCHQAAEQDDINHYTARDYMRMYRDTNQLPCKTNTKLNTNFIATPSTPNNKANIQEYQDMSKEDLIKALIQARITEWRFFPNHSKRSE